MSKVGFSTGALYRLGMSPVEQAEAIANAGSTAIEISCFTLKELDKWSRLEQEGVDFIKRTFGYISIHSPVKGASYKSASPETREILGRLASLAESFEAQLVTFHADMIKDPRILSSQPFTVSIENMGVRQMAGHNVENLEHRFKEFPFAKLTFDVNHAFEIDPTGEEAKLIMERFGDRIMQIHISGLTDDAHHTLYSTSSSDAHLDCIRTSAAPLIHEGVISNIPQLTREADYVNSRLAS